MSKADLHRLLSPEDWRAICRPIIMDESAFMEDHIEMITYTIKGEVTNVSKS